ncbi:unnamed protein product [Prorocentrum cordatum]|uniref:Neurotransmitter-gated ion-channel ligand-binding domain-containing protein n=1 Tax=Prorocentrum cordatum TaxID=2364126 RepID=A0ABN9WJX2_9DINO|nr:unnamed protein product [Polarella glacialis]
MAPAGSDETLRLPGVISVDGGPDALSEATTEVRVRLTVFDVPEITISASRFTCNFFLEASWLDESMKDEDALDVGEWAPQFPVKGQSTHGRWTPMLHFYNVLELKDKEEWYVVYKRDRADMELLPTPVVCYRMRATGVFRERFELYEFPFDSQDLQIQIVSLHPCVDLPTQSEHLSGKTNVTLKMNHTDEYACVAPGDDKDRFTLYDEYIMQKDVREKNERTLADHSTTRKTYPLLTLYLKVTRRPGFYLWQVYFPMWMLVLLAFPILLLPVSDFGNRLSYLSTLLLAAISYKNWLGNVLPKCSYLTFIDQYVLVSIGVIFVVTMESAVVFWLWKQMSDPPKVAMEEMEDFLGFSASVCWTCWHVWFCQLQERHDPNAVKTENEKINEARSPRAAGSRSPKLKRLPSWVSSRSSGSGSTSLTHRMAQIKEDFTKED